MGRLDEKEIYERRRKLCTLEAIYKWWKGLTDMRQYEIMLTWYPTEVKEDTDIDKMFGDMPYENQLEIYKKEKHQVFKERSMGKLTLRTDGSCIPNPGDMGIGVVIYEGKTIVETISQFIGYGTNNIAEYTAFIRGLEEAKKRKKKDDQVKIFIDSLLIYKQIKGEYRVKKRELKPLCERGKELIKEIGNIEIIWNSRDENGIADCLAKTAIETERKEQ